MPVGWSGCRTVVVPLELVFELEARMYEALKDLQSLGSHSTLLLLLGAHGSTRASEYARSYRCAAVT